MSRKSREGVPLAKSTAARPPARREAPESHSLHEAA